MKVKRASVKAVAAKLQKKGRNGDTILAHINPKEYALLDRVTDGVGTNPETGLPAFDDDGSDGYGGGGANDAAGMGAAGGGIGPGSGGGDYGPDAFGPNGRNLGMEEQQQAQRDVVDSYGIGGWDAFAGLNKGVPQYAPDFVNAVGKGFWGDYAGALEGRPDAFSRNLINLLNPFPGVRAKPGYDPIEGTRGYSWGFSPGGAVSGVAGAMAGVPGLGLLGSQFGPQYDLGYTPFGDPPSINDVPGGDSASQEHTSLGAVATAPAAAPNASQIASFISGPSAVARGFQGYPQTPAAPWATRAWENSVLGSLGGVR